MKEPITSNLGGKTIYIYYDPVANSAVVKDKSGILIPSIQSYWFAWVAFYPDTKIYRY